MINKYNKLHIKNHSCDLPPVCLCSPKATPYQPEHPQTHHPSQSFSSKPCVILSLANPLHWRGGRVPLPTETGEP